MSKKKLQKEIENLPEKSLRVEREEKKSKRNDLIKIIKYLNDKYEFRYNLFAAKPEYRIKEDKKKTFAFFNEREFDNLYNEVEIDLGIRISRDRLTSLIGSDKMSAEYEPIRDYIFSLPKWDGKDRFNDFLKQIQLMDEENHRPLLVKYFKRWFVALVASLIDDHVINENAIVFTGKQGRGKTRFFTSLVPEDLRLMYMYSGSFNPKDKDHYEMLGTKILINLDEMATLNRNDIETLKSTMSQRYVVLRRAFGRAPIHLFRRASFCGSHNDEKFLTDQTGNRRWLPFAIHDVDVDESFDINLLYAQALQMWRDGYKIWMDKQEIDDFEVYNDNFRFVPAEEDLIAENYVVPEEKDEKMGVVEYLSTTALIHRIASKDEYRKMNVNDTSLKRMGKALKALGFRQVTRRIGNKPRKVWVVRKIDSYSSANNLKSDENEEIM